MGRSGFRLWGGSNAVGHGRVHVARLGRGFTLIESMIIVAMIGVLSVLAVLGYRRWVRSAYMTEAHDMVSSIRAAQESFRAENAGYLSVSNGLGVGSDYPLLTPGPQKTQWGGACAGCVNAVKGW